MKEICYRVIYDHLKKHLQTDSTLLVAISGGPDSVALLELLVEAQRHFSFSIELVHIDHGLGPGNGDAGRAIGERYPFPLHFLQLEGSSFSSPNLEERWREERLRFFKCIYQRIGAGALVLGHHKGDLAETVFKRLAEGAPLVRLWGMREQGQFEGMSVWRPLLSLTKKELLSYLEKKGVPYAVDQMNEASRFLRGRLRSEIFPQIEKTFGKSLIHTLPKLAERSFELEDYLEKKVAFLKGDLEKGEVRLDLLASLHRLELHYLISSFSKEKGKNLSDQEIETLIKCIQQRKGGKRVSAFRIQTNSLHFDIVNQKLD